MMAVIAGAQSVNFKLSTDHGSYVLGEAINFSLRIVNLGVAPILISNFDAYKDNRLDIEIKDQDGKIINCIKQKKIIDELSIEKDEGKLIKINLTEWYTLMPGHYQIRVMLICNGLRYDSPIEVFDVVPGFDLASNTHYISLRPAVERTLKLVYWTRDGRETAFLRAEDSPVNAICRSIMLGDILRVKNPSIERKSGEKNTFYIYRQATRNVITRTEVVSDTDGIRVVDTKRKIESSSAPMIDSLRNAIEEKSKSDKR